MFLNKYPMFERGRILKLEMLENLRDFPRDIFSILMESNSDGIIEGCDISASENYLVVSRGILCFRKILYVLKEKVKIPYESTNEWMLLKIKFLSEGRSKDFLSYTTQIFLDKDSTIKNDEMELCRFKLREGAVLRGEYEDFGDLETEYDTICTIEVPYSGKGKSTLNPAILSRFAKEALSYPVKNSLDAAFCMSCLSEGVRLGRDMLFLYLRNREFLLEEESSNQEIYHALKMILQEIQHGEKQGIKNHFSQRRVLLD